MTGRVRAADDFAAIRDALAQLRVERQMAEAERAVEAGCRCDWLLFDDGLVPQRSPDCPMHAETVPAPAIGAGLLLPSECRD
jgi:hypothetical protein